MKWWLLPVLVLILLTALFMLDRDEGPAIRLLAGAGLRPGVEPLIAAFEARHGIRVLTDYAGSGVLLTRVQCDRRVDCFLPGEAWYVDRLAERCELAERREIGQLRPVMIVAAGNPKGITGLADLTRDDLVVGLGRAEATSIGRLSDTILSKAGLARDRLRCQESLTVNELGIWIQFGSVDVAIVWQATAANLGAAVDRVELLEGRSPVCHLQLARLATARPEAALFCEFAASPEGQAILRAAGYVGSKD